MINRETVGYKYVSDIPMLNEEWDYDSNSPIMPNEVSIGSSLKVWWICKNGHKWQAVVYSRTKQGCGCPYCSGRRVLSGYNDLLTTHPLLAEEWDYSKNVNISPETISFGSPKKVWWKCEKGHSWEASVNNRSKGRGCPYCSPSKTSMPEQGIAFYLESCCKIEQRISIEGKEVDIFLPDYKIGIEYDGIRFHQSPRQMRLDSEKDLCLRKNNILLIRIKEDNTNYVEDRYVIHFNTDDMGQNYEWALRELLQVLSQITNLPLNSSIDVNIKRDRPKIRERFNLTKKKDSLSNKYPLIAEEWDYDKNGILKPDMFASGSNERVWWKCKLGHSWSEKINNRTCRNNIGCPYCSSHRLLSGFNDLQTKNPALASEWDYEKNAPMTPLDVLSSSSKTVWWKCEKGHCWLASVNNRSKGQGCPYCSNKKILTGYNDLQTLCPALAQEWNYDRNGLLTPLNIGIGSGKKVWWRCAKGHEWQVSVNDRYRDKLNCPYCSGRKSGRVMCIETGDVYSGTQEASNITGINAGNIAGACKGKYKTAGGFHWKYCDK